MRCSTFLVLGLLEAAVVFAPARLAAEPAERSALDAQVEEYSRALEQDPGSVRLWNARGGTLFQLGRVDDSIRDFDEAIRLQPEGEPYHWQRGISYYYAGRFADGRRQFEIHRSVNPHDVENAAWHFICAVRDKGLAWARANLIPIQSQRDTRVPMREIYLLFSGRGSAQKVLEAAGTDNPSSETSRQRHNYAHLYLGLWYEATGGEDLTRYHMEQAAVRYRMDNYMGSVSVVHLGRMTSRRYGGGDEEPRAPDP